MPDYIIHIGPHKTGSTYLQSAFHQLQGELQAHDILYPQRWYITPQAPNHRPLFLQLESGGSPALKANFDILATQQYKSILFSAEDFSNLSMRGLSALHALIGHEKVRFVFYCRRWSELVASSWQEWIKHGESFSLLEYYFHEITHLGKSRKLNFSLVLDRIAAVFGRDSLVLISYNNIVDAKEDILTHFMEHVLSITDLPTQKKRIANASYPLEEIEAIRALNAIEWQETQRKGIALRNAYLDFHKELSLEKFRHAVAERSEFLVFDDSSAWFHDLHAHILRAYGERCLNLTPDGRLFAERRRRVPYMSANYFLADGVVGELLAAYQHLHQKLQVPG